MPWLLLLAALRVGAQTPIALRAEAFINSLLPESKIPGLSVAVAHPNGSSLVSGFGVKDITMPPSVKNNVTADTLFEIGSCSKTFIAAGLAQFVASGRIKWETPVVSVLDWFQGFDPYMTKNVNIADLLAHRTGLGDHDGDVLWLFGGVSSEEELVRRLQYLPPRTSMRDTFMYSNIGYEIAVIVLEKLAGTSWAEYLATTLWEPLILKSTVGSFDQAYSRTAFSLGHYVWYKNDASMQALPFDYFADSTPKLSPGIREFGAGTIISNADDMYKWLTFLLSDNSTLAMEQGQMTVPLPWASDFMMLPQEPTGNSFAAGFGFDVVGQTFYNQRFFGNGGDTLFHKTRTGFLPEAGIAVAVMANLQGDYVTELYLAGIRNAMLQMFSGATDEQVQAEWAKVKSIIDDQRAKLPSTLPNNTLNVPLKSGPLTYKYRTFLAPLDQSTVIAKCDSEGLPPLQAAAGYVGTYSNPYYGKFVVGVSSRGVLNASYGTFSGALCRMSVSAGSSEDFLFPNATALSALFSSAYINTTFSDFKQGQPQNVNFIGIDFNRNSAKVQVRPVPSLLPRSYGE